MERLAVGTTGQSTMSGHHTPLQDAIAKARTTRNSLAGTVRGALIQLERTPAGSSSDRRAVHEVACLQQALAALMQVPPEPKQLGIDGEINRLMRDLAREEQHHQPLEAQLGLAK